MENDDLFEMKLNGKVALVTGAAKGLGKACALGLARAGADIALGLRNSADAVELENQIREMGRQVIKVQMDVSSLDQIRSAIDMIYQFGRQQFTLAKNKTTLKNKIYIFKFTVSQDQTSK